MTEQECLAALLSILKFRPYIEGHPFKDITDHASLQWLMNLKDLSGRLARWSLKLQSFDFQIDHRKGKLHVVPDALSRVFVEALGEHGKTDLEIDLNSPDFNCDEYQSIAHTINSSGDRLPDLKTDGQHIYKMTGQTDGEPTEPDECPWKLWIPAPMTSNMIANAHCSTLSSHCGVRKTLEKLRRYFYWPSMAKQVHEYVSACDTCKQSKAPKYTLRPPMGKQMCVDRPWQRICIDLIGPYPRSTTGNSFALVVLDQLTKYVLIKPLRKATTESVGSFLESEVFHVYGVPEFVHSDNGSQFTSKKFGELMGNYGIQHTFTALYSPHANPSERVNRSIVSAIRAYIREDQRTWDVYISSIASAIRNTVHLATKHTPHRLIFGSNLITHGSIYRLLRELDCSYGDEPSIVPPTDRLRLLYAKVQENLRGAHAKYARTYNVRSRVNSFEPGQRVFRRNFILSSKSDAFNAKLAPKFVPCHIVRKIGSSHYDVTDGVRGRVGTYHAKDLRL